MNRNDSQPTGSTATDSISTIQSEENEPGSDRMEVPFRGAGFAPRPIRGVAVAVFVGLILIIEWGTHAGFISNLTLPRPSDVFATFQQLWSSGLLWKHLAPSLSRLSIGAAFGVSAGMAIGILIGLFSLIRASLVPLVAALFPIPKIALLPLFVIWFGIDETSKYALIAFGTFTPTVVATWPLPSSCW